MASSTKQSDIIDLSGDDDDVEYVGERGIVAGIHLPHLRENCLVHPVNGKSDCVLWKICCPKCFCFICDTKVEECSNWEDHCTHISTNTNSQRKRKENLIKVNNPFHDCPPCVFLKALCQNNLPERKTPNDLNGQLYGYQKQALQFIVNIETCNLADERVGISTSQNHYRGGILAASTGLGKTVIIIASILDEHERNKIDTTSYTASDTDIFNYTNNKENSIYFNATLYITQNSLPIQTKEEFSKYAPKLRVGILFDVQGKEVERFPYNYDVIITTYHRTIPKGWSFNRIIFDESHLLDDTFHRLKYCLQISKLSNIIWLVSGTPLDNSPYGNRLVTQLELLRHRLGHGLFKDIILSRDYSIHFKTQLQKILLRIEKENIDQLDSKEITYETIPIAMSDYENIIYKYAKCSDTKFEYLRIENVTDLKQCKCQFDSVQYDFNKLSCMTKFIGYMKKNSELKNAITLFEVLPSQSKDANSNDTLAIRTALDNIGKFNYLRNMLTSVSEDDKIIIFVRSKVTAKTLVEYLRLNSIRISNCVVDSAVSRQKALKKFQEDNNIRTIVLKYDQSSVGITLTTANNIILFEPSMDISQRDQAIARINRIGQERNMKCSTLFYENTIEECIIDLYKHCETKRLETFTRKIKMHTVDENHVIQRTIRSIDPHSQIYDARHDSNNYVTQTYRSKLCTCCDEYVCVYQRTATMGRASVTRFSINYN